MSDGMTSKFDYSHKLQAVLRKESVIMNNKSKWIKAIGVAATVIGVGVNLITDWVNEQKMDEKIEEKVNEALAQRDKDEAEES